MGGSSPGNITPQVPALMSTAAAAQNIFQIFDLQSAASSKSGAGLELAGAELILECQLISILQELALSCYMTSTWPFPVPADKVAL